MHKPLEVYDRDCIGLQLSFESLTNRNIRAFLIGLARAGFLIKLQHVVTMFKASYM